MENKQEPRLTTGAPRLLQHGGEYDLCLADGSQVATSLPGQKEASAGRVRCLRRPGSSAQTCRRGAGWSRAQPAADLEPQRRCLEKPRSRVICCTRTSQGVAAPAVAERLREPEDVAPHSSQTSLRRWPVTGRSLVSSWARQQTDGNSSSRSPVFFPSSLPGGSHRGSMEPLGLLI